MRPRTPLPVTIPPEPLSATAVTDLGTVHGTAPAPAAPAAEAAAPGLGVGGIRRIPGSDGTVTVSPVSRTAVIPPYGPAGIGFLGARIGSDDRPSAFTPNGAARTAG